MAANTGQHFIFGHAVVSREISPGDRRWFYTDTGMMHVSREGTVAGTEAVEPRPCPRCGLLPTAAGHDPCIANLPGVEFACCGHGVHPGYIKFEDGRIVRGAFTQLPEPRELDETSDD